MTTASPLATLPSSATFSFTAPFPPTSQPSTSSPLSSHKQQRRVSLALPSSPRQFPAWSFRDDTSVGVGGASTSTLVPEKKGKMRRICNEDDDSEFTPEGMTALPPHLTQNTGAETKKQRRKWTAQETQMLVDGCQKWGVGNWKAILNDPELKFDNRSPVDLKDRFRTHFPDAYKHHYPNAKTHLSTKARPTNADVAPLFCASRSKKRRPFTPEEDAALKAGYDKHGTVWATIVKDPIFQDQHRRSTDLRDRFRNAWPELYAKAGYKPRATAGKKKRCEVEISTSPLEDNEGSTKERGRTLPVRAATDDQIPSTSTMGGPVRRKRRHTTHGFGLFRGGTKSVPESMVNSEDEDSCSDEEAESLPPPTTVVPQQASFNSTDMNMEPLAQDTGVPDFLSSSSLSVSDITDSSQSQSQTWSTLDTPLHPWSTSTLGSQGSNISATTNAYSDSLAASPTPSTDYFLPNSPSVSGNTGMIGKSAWGPQDWLSPNPRLDPGGTSTNSSHLYAGGLFSPSPIASPSPYPSNQVHPLSLAHLSLNYLGLPHSQTHGAGGTAFSQGVFDRYDLFPLSHDLDLDLDFVSEGFGGTGDTHSAFSDPSAWTGTSGMRAGGFTHHSNYAGDLIFGSRTHQPHGHGHLDYGPGFGFGLGLEGVSSQSVLHTPALPGIDEIELTGITLDDRDPEQEMGMVVENTHGADVSLPSDDMAPSTSHPDGGINGTFTPLALEEIVGIPPNESVDGPQAHGRSLDHDMSNHVTPPATPAVPYRVSGRAHGIHGTHNRSVSVPPSEHRAVVPPRPGHSQVVSPRVKYKPLNATPKRATFNIPQAPSIPAPISQPPSQPPAQQQSYLPPTDFENYDLPFLDLHYYTNSDTGSSSNMFAASTRPLGAQALDLAQTLAQSLAHSHVSHTKSQLCISPSLMQLPPSDRSNHRLSSIHQRGQSVAVVSPQDLLLRKGSDNKRKRSSWDGGPA